MPDQQSLDRHVWALCGEHESLLLHASERFRLLRGLREGKLLPPEIGPELVDLKEALQQTTRVGQLVRELQMLCAEVEELAQANCVDVTHIDELDTQDPLD